MAVKRSGRARSYYCTQVTELLAMCGQKIVAWVRLLAAMLAW